MRLFEIFRSGQSHNEGEVKHYYVISERVYGGDPTYDPWYNISFLVLFKEDYK